LKKTIGTIPTLTAPSSMLQVEPSSFTTHSYTYEGLSKPLLPSLNATNLPVAVYLASWAKYTRLARPFNAALGARLKTDKSKGSSVNFEAGNETP
jgi:pectin methylesterase-like acyl-CoA thioesterase